MQLRFFQYLGTVLALLLATAAPGAQPSKDNSKPERLGTTYVKITFRIFVTEAGIPKKVEFLAIEPSVGPSDQADLTKAAADAIREWRFTPNTENGKPVAGELVVPVILDLADPVPIAVKAPRARPRAKSAGGNNTIPTQPSP